MQRKTLDLLYRMTNPVNVEFISDKLIDFLSGTTDLFLKRVLTSRVCSIAERYAPNNAWYIKTVTKLFEVSGDMVPQDVAQNLMSLIAEGTGESEEADMLLRQNAVEIYVGLLRDKPVGSLPRILLETMAWCLGEYGYLSAASTLDDVLTQLCTLAQVHKAKLAASTRKFLVTAIMKLVAQAGTCPPHAAAVIDDYTRSRDMDLQQRCLEFQNLLTNCPSLLPQILPVDASAEDMDVDENLSFLDGYVQQALANGARPYEKPEDDDDDDYAGSSSAQPAPSAFKMTPYEKPKAPSQVMLAMSGIGSAGRTNTMAGVSLPPGSQPSGSTLPTPSASAAPPPGGLMLNTRNVANKWGKGGLSQEATAPPAAPPASAPATSAWESSSTGAGSSASSAYGSNMGRFGTPSAAAPPSAPVKTAEQLEKERMAAALFGGIVPGAPPPPPPPAPTSHAQSYPAPAAPVAAPPVTAPPPTLPAPASAPEVDLLDMGLWDASPTPAPAAFEAAPTSVLPVPASALHSAAVSAPIVETVSDDFDDAGAEAAPASTKAPVAAAPPTTSAYDDDPFAGAGLLGDVTDKPLVSLSMTSSNRFEYHGSPMAPLQITTAQFGQQWGACTATSPVTVVSSKITSLDNFMSLCADMGAHKVEAIVATNEGICAGMLGGGSQIVLVHAKLSPLSAGQTRIDATVKSSDQSLSGSLAMYLQTLVR